MNYEASTNGNSNYKPATPFVAPTNATPQKNLVESDPKKIDTSYKKFVGSSANIEPADS